MGVDKLTPREREVLALMAQGASTREIEGKLVLTAGAVSKHVRSTGQIGKFVLLGTNWDEISRTFRVRFKLV